MAGGFEHVSFFSRLVIKASFFLVRVGEKTLFLILFEGDEKTSGFWGPVNQIDGLGPSLVIASIESKTTYI